MTLPAERIDGFYIGYRQMNSIGVDNNNNNNIDALDKAKGNMPTYTFKTMYDLNKFNYLANASAFPGIASNEADIDNFQTMGNNNNNNVTTFCEVLLSPDEINDRGENGNNMNRPQQQQQQLRSSHRSRSKLEQVRCTYEFIVGGLARLTKFGFVVQAFNAKGAGPTSPETYAQTLPKDPPGKSHIRLLNVTSYEASIGWEIDEPPFELDVSSGNVKDESSRNIDGYIISYRAMSRKYVLESGSIDAAERALIEQNNKMTSMKLLNTNSWETITVTRKASSYTLRNLRCGTNYRLKVEAFNEMGNGLPSDTLEFATIGRSKC